MESFPNTFLLTEFKQAKNCQQKSLLYLDTCTLTDSLFSLWHREHPVQWWPRSLAHAPGWQRVADPAHADGWGCPTPAHHHALRSRQLRPDHWRVWGGAEGCPALEWPRGHRVNQVTELCGRALVNHRHEARGNNFWSRTSLTGKYFWKEISQSFIYIVYTQQL